MDESRSPVSKLKRLRLDAAFFENQLLNTLHVSTIILYFNM